MKRMRSITTALALGLALAGVATLAHAGEATFTVRCMHTAGPKILPKYGTYYFFLKEAQVKGYACSVPGQPCKIVSQDANTIAFQTPGEAPDRMTIDLRNGAIQHKTASGLQATFACRQVPNGT
jgi:hypothetical protein